MRACACIKEGMNIFAEKMLKRCFSPKSFQKLCAGKYDLSVNSEGNQ